MAERADFSFMMDDVDLKLAAMSRDATIVFGPLSFDAFIPGWRSVWLRDPGGNIVQITQGFQNQPYRPSGPPTPITNGEELSMSLITVRVPHRAAPHRPTQSAPYHGDGRPAGRWSTMPMRKFADDGCPALQTTVMLDA